MNTIYLSPGIPAAPEPMPEPRFDLMTPNERIAFVRTLDVIQLRALCCKLADDCDALMAALGRVQ